MTCSELKDETGDGVPALTPDLGRPCVFLLFFPTRCLCHESSMPWQPALLRRNRMRDTWSRAAQLTREPAVDAKPTLDALSPRSPADA